MDVKYKLKQHCQSNSGSCMGNNHVGFLQSTHRQGQITLLVPGMLGWEEGFFVLQEERNIIPSLCWGHMHTLSMCHMSGFRKDTAFCHTDYPHACSAFVSAKTDTNTQHSSLRISISYTRRLQPIFNMSSVIFTNHPLMSWLLIIWQTP